MSARQLSEGARGPARRSSPPAHASGHRRSNGHKPLLCRSRASIPGAHIARVYNYWLGGQDNFAADRAAAEVVITSYPTVPASVRAQREFLGRAVSYLAGEAGIRQFLDIGTGLPSAGNTHEVAQRVAPESRIVYVDNDRFKSGCAHANDLCPGCPGALWMGNG